MQPEHKSRWIPLTLLRLCHKEWPNLTIFRKTQSCQERLDLSITVSNYQRVVPQTSYITESPWRNELRIWISNFSVKKLKFLQIQMRKELLFYIDFKSNYMTCTKSHVKWQPWYLVKQLSINVSLYLPTWTTWNILVCL